MIYIAVGLIFCVGAVTVLLLRAPEGYEDDEGFHYGSEQDAVDLTECRNDITGQPLTMRERFDRECG